MTPGESPAVARRRLRLALRKIREARGVTQSQVAEALEWSLSKVNRIESGDVTISNTDLRAFLGFLQVHDLDLIERLTNDARASRRKGWWDEARYREHLPGAALRFIQFENEANAIRCFQPTLIPGLLQTRAYADSVLQFWSQLSEMQEEDHLVRLEVRMRRKAQVFDQPDPPRYFLILDESTVLREVGGPRVMAEQLQTVLDIVDHPQITVRVVQLADGALLSTLGAFTIIDLNDEENAILYRETSMFDDITEAPTTINRYRHIFEQMWERALSEEVSVRLLRARAATMLAALNQDPPHS